MNLQVYVTKHAAERFQKRARNRWSKEILTNLSATMAFVETQIRTGKRLYDWECCPFYKNKVECRYGKTVVFKKSGLFFICKPEESGVRCITVVPRFP